MRILLLAAASSTHTLRWAEAYAAHGHEVHLVSQHPPSAALSSSIHFHGLGLRGGLGYFLNGPQLKDMVRRIAPEVVNAHYASGYGTLARWVLGLPVVLNVWGSDVFEFPSRSFLHRMMLLSALKHADLLVSTSETMARGVRDLIKDKELWVVPFGVDTGVFVPDHRKGPVVTIGTVKALEPVYGVDRLVEAFIRLRATGRDVRLRIVGGGSMETALRERVKAIGAEDLVTFVGEVAHALVPEELKRMDVFVALSRAESFGVAVIEASATGIPVLVSDVGGLPEVVEHGVTGFVVDPEDPEKVDTKLQGLVDDAAMRTRMGQEGRRLVCERYDWDHCVELQVRVLQAAAQQGSGK